MMLAFMAHGYIWGGNTPSEVSFLCVYPTRINADSLS
jgi:hypothetical protein